MGFLDEALDRYGPVGSSRFGASVDPSDPSGAGTSTLAPADGGIPLPDASTLPPADVQTAANAVLADPSSTTGSYSATLLSFQQAYNAASGQAPIGTDGLYGSETRAALMQYTQSAPAVPAASTASTSSSSASLPSYLGATFFSDLTANAKSIGADPTDILALLLNESGGALDPSKKNPTGFPAGQYAVGINQFAPVSWPVFAPLTVVQYAALTAAQQLPYVFKFWRGYLQKYGLTSISARDLYWINFLPATYVPNSPDSYVIVSPTSGYFAPNKGLARDPSVGITAGDLQAAIDRVKTRNSMFRTLAQYLKKGAVIVAETGAVAWGGYWLVGVLFAGVFFLVRAARRTP